MLQPEDHKTIKFVCDSLGRTLTALLSGTRDQLDVDRWLMGGKGHKHPTNDQLDRVRFAQEMFKKVSETEGSHTTRAWFMGSNVGSDECSPSLAIRDGRFEEVRISANRIINDEWA